MEIFNIISKSGRREEILDDLCRGHEGPFDLAILFISPTASDTLKEMVRELKARLQIKHFLGCSGAGIIGSQEEIEHDIAASLYVARLPGVQIHPFYMNDAQRQQNTSVDNLVEFFDVYPNEGPNFLLFPDPMSFDIGQFLEDFNKAYPKTPIFGGLASAMNSEYGNVIVMDDEIFTEGAVGAILKGNIVVDSIVSQGCRPVGESYIVTKAEQNIIYELAGRPFLKVLEEIMLKISDYDRKLAQQAIFVGIVMDEYKDNYKRGDFLIRGVVGIDSASGAGAIADYIHAGQTIQFHLRDAQTATEDLNALLLSYQEKHNGRAPKGALVFSCNGRGQMLFGQPNHDINLIQKYLGPIPAAGFFCAGEIGPIGPKNFLHGFTDSIALFYPKE